VETIAEQTDVMSARDEARGQALGLRKVRTEGLVKEYGRRRVVNQVSIALHQGEIVGLLGPNGAGKTTTFNMIVGMIRPNEGSIFIDDHEITRKPMYQRARLGVGYLPQESSIFRKLTVAENIMAILEMLPLSPNQRKERANVLLDELKVGHLRDHFAYTLSGGERRRVEIARALATRPDFILLDEPFAGIDPIAVEDIQAIVADLRRKRLGVLITDHNVRETLEVCTRAYLLNLGEVIAHGNAQELSANESARKFYLGEEFTL